MSTQIKICGIQYLEEILMINELPIDYIGFVFAPSKRKITFKKALMLKKKLKKNIKIVGVFVNEDIEIVNSFANKLALDIVQLHGEEDFGYIKNINGKVWKAYQVNEAFDEKRIINGKNIVGNLYDGKNPGSGKVFNWEYIKKINHSNKKILAGGLNPYNIERAIESVKPDIIDISTGVERNNRKNNQLLIELVRRVKND